MRLVGLLVLIGLVCLCGGGAAAQIEVPQIPKISVRAKATEAPSPAFPEAARVAGHHGTAILSGNLSDSGNLTDVIVKQSSGSLLLDQSALEGIKAWRFAPALDLDGKPIATRITVPIEFYSFKTADGGINHYNCRQWIADTEWYATTHSDLKKDQFYLMMSGFSFAGAVTSYGTNADALKKASDRFDRNWATALAKCRSTPDKLVRDVLELR